jgi:predicted transcriptional regulator
MDEKIKLKKTNTITISLNDEELRSKLEKIAKQEDRSKSYIMKKALKQYIENFSLNI